MIATDNMIIPKGAQHKYTAELMIDWVYDVDRAARIAAFVYYVSPVKGVAEAIKALDPDAATNPLLFPPPEVLAKQHPAADLGRADRRQDERAVRRPERRLGAAQPTWEDSRSVTRHRWLIPYLLLLPGLLWLAIFFVLPNIQMFLMSLSTKGAGSGLTQQYEFTWAFSNYADALTDFPDQFANSLVYGGLATLFCLLIGYPLAYGIAFRGGRYKNLLLFLVIAPFFTSFLIRTISWKIILGNDGAFLSIVRDVLGLVPDNFSVLGTPLAVVSGLTYQFLPFMVLPLYVSLEKIDRRLIEAAQDLYAGPQRQGGALIGGIAGAVLAVAVMAGLSYLPAVDELCSSTSRWSPSSGR